MNATLAEIIHGYLRELSAQRKWLALGFLVIAVGSLAVALNWPKSYTSTATIYGDNSNILKPLMAGNAVATSIGDQARMAREIMFKRSYNDEILKAGGWDPDRLSPLEKDNIISSIQGRTAVSNVGRQPASLIRITFRDVDPIRAFSIAQKYTSLFIEESVVTRRQESRSAFDFIQNQVTEYQTKLQTSEDRLSRFKTENYYGTMGDANSRISRYRAEIERLELDLVQLDTEQRSVEAELAGETEIVRDMNAMVALRNRINSLHQQLDTLRSRYHDTYPDVIRVQMQIDDLMHNYEQGNPGLLISSDDLDKPGVGGLHQELRGRVSTIKTSIQSKTTQLNGIRALLENELNRVKQINEADAILAELTRDYNVNRDFYNELLKRRENARVSMNLDEQQQGVTFKVQESAAIPTQPDGLGLIHLLAGSFIVAVGVPLGLLVVFVEMDPRIRTESHFNPEWPPLLMSVPPMKTIQKRRFLSDGAFVACMLVLSIGLYGGAAVMSVNGYV